MLRGSHQKACASGIKSTMLKWCEKCGLGLGVAFASNVAVADTIEFQVETSGYVDAYYDINGVGGYFSGGSVGGPISPGQTASFVAYIGIPCEGTTVQEFGACFGSWSYQISFNGTILASGGQQICESRSNSPFTEPFCLPGDPAVNFGFTDPPVGIPGPTAGAGLPGMALAGAGLLAWWRRRRAIPGLTLISSSDL
jgi:hypothetical protein